MKGMNRVTLIGNVGKDPETKHLEDGTSVVKLSLATTETFKDPSGQSHSQTEWHTVVLWRRLAELAAKYLKKGSLICIEGSLKTRSFEVNGDKRYITEVVAQELILLDKKSESS